MHSRTVATLLPCLLQAARQAIDVEVEVGIVVAAQMGSTVVEAHSSRVVAVQATGSG